MEKIYKNSRKVAVYLNRGRPKNLIPRDEKLTLRLSKSELQKISRVAKQKNLTRTNAILKGIDLLELDKPKKFKNLSGDNKISDVIIAGESVPLKK